MKDHLCYICGNSSDNKEYSFNDYHFKTPGSYIYFQCPICGCLQYDFETNHQDESIYPVNYYSFKIDDNRTLSSKIKWLIRSYRNSYYQSGKGIIGAAIHCILPCMSVAALYKMNILKDWRILDVGCGNDALMLQHLSHKNFLHLTGIDPFIQKEVQKLGNITILKKTVHQIDGKFDLITFNHSFEHMPDGRDVLLRCNELISNEGIILIRIPIVNSFAWEHYERYWVNLDAPRHYFLHSIKSVSMLIDQCGFKINSLFCDSTPSQFWGSELYKTGTPLGGKLKKHQQIKKLILRIYYSFKKYKTVQDLNENLKGDSIALLIKKK